MAQAAQETRQEFWRPPTPMMAADRVIGENSTAMAEVCPGCGTEFLFGSRFCHTCGVRRPAVMSDTARADAAVIAGMWQQVVDRVQTIVARVRWNAAWKNGPWKDARWKKFRFPAWMQYLHYHEIRQRTGLSTGSLVAFVIGMGCIFGALLVGLLTAKNYVDWQAIQFYRAEWLLAATAAFVAGILLKKPSQRDGE
jgi:hypothetical protein